MSYSEDSIETIERTLKGLRPKLLEYFGNIDHELKEDNSPVTKLDKHVELKLKEELKQLDPSIGYYGEEFGTEGNQEKFWLIDPIDGTQSFIRGLPFCTNMLCLIENGQPVASVIYNFVLDDFYSAIKGQGAYRNKQKICVSNREINHAGVEFETKANKLENREKYFNMPRHQFYTFSVAGFGLTQVACGAIEARIANDGWGQVYDFAPGALLVQEAGGRVANIRSKEYDYKNLNFIASNQLIHDELQAAFL